MFVSFLIPVCNERDTLAPLVAGITEHVGALPHRILLIDDGSDDGSWEAMCALRADYPTLDLIRFRRNYGKTLALAVGFAQIDGDVAITMDGDLQDDPAEIPRLLATLDAGYDLVCGWKARRQDPWHKTFPSRVFNAGIARAFGLPLHDVNTGFKAMRMEVAKRLPMRGNLHRFIPVLAAHYGYRVTEIPVAHHPRRYGQSKYGFFRIFHGLRDAALLGWRLRVLNRPPSMPEIEPDTVIAESHLQGDSSSANA